MPGTWYGSCEEGRAQGLGYGLVRADDDTAIEYLGSTSNGLPNGLGAMILRSPQSLGAIYYEGQFAGGLPNGILRLEQPGRRTETRKFMNGKNVGPADDLQLSPIQFH